MSIYLSICKTREREREIVYECTSHPSDIKNLTFYRFVVMDDGCPLAKTHPSLVNKIVMKYGHG